MKMNHTHTTWWREPRFLIMAGGVTLLVVVTALAMVQTPTLAAPPPPLRGPFQFIELLEGALAASAADLTYTPIYTQDFTFGGDFTGWNPILNTEVYPNPAPHKWGRVQYNQITSESFTNTLWAVADPYPVLSVDWTVHTDSAYTKTMDTWAIYGPLNTQQYYRFNAAFRYWLDSESGGKLQWGYSCDGTRFYGTSSTYGHVQQWLPMSFDLAACPGDSRPPAYIVFRFTSSNTQTPIGLGAFVDDVVISAVSWNRTFLPLIRNDGTPTPTATPPYALNKTYDFDSYDGWCQHTGYVDNWLTEIRSVGGLNSYVVGVNTGGKWAMTSPHYDPPSNYRIEGRFTLLDKGNINLASYAGAKWGLIFGVEGTPFDPGDSAHCGYSPTVGGFYKFSIKIKDDGSGYQTKLERWYNGGKTELIPLTDLPSGVTITKGDWNVVALNRSGSSIVVMINGGTVINTTDNTWPGMRWWGLFTDEPDGYGLNQPFEADWDYIKVYNIGP